MMAKHHDITPDILYPTLYDVLMSLKNNVMSSLRVCLPATITAVHSAARKVDVTIAVMQLDGQGIPTNYPAITGCPIITMQGGGIATVFPVAVEDQCLIFFSDRCLDAWKKSGTATPLPFLRMHDLSDGFALVGVNVPNPLVNFMTTTEGGITSPLAKVAIDKTTQKITIANSFANLYLVLLSVLTPLSTDPGLSSGTKTAILGAIAQLGLLLY